MPSKHHLKQVFKNSSSKELLCHSSLAWFHNFPNSRETFESSTDHPSSQCLSQAAIWLYVTTRGCSYGDGMLLREHPSCLWEQGSTPRRREIPSIVQTDKVEWELLKRTSSQAPSTYSFKKKVRPLWAIFFFMLKIRLKIDSFHIRVCRQMCIPWVVSLLGRCIHSLVFTHMSRFPKGLGTLAGSHLF